MKVAMRVLENSPWSCTHVTMSAGANRYHRLSAIEIGWYRGSILSSLCWDGSFSIIHAKNSFLLTKHLKEIPRILLYTKERLLSEQVTNLREKYAAETGWKHGRFQPAKSQETI